MAGITKQRDESFYYNTAGRKKKLVDTQKEHLESKIKELENKTDARSLEHLALYKTRLKNIDKFKRSKNDFDSKKRYYI